MEEALIVASVLVATTNAWVICMVISIKELRTFTNYFVVSLAVSDLLTGGVLLPIHLFPLSMVSEFINFFIFIVGVANLCAVTWERYIATMQPFEYKQKLKKYHKPILIVVWTIPLLFSLLPLAWKANDKSIYHKSYLVSTLLILVTIPYALIISAYVRIWLRLRSHAAQMRRIDTTNKEKEGARRASLEGKTVKIFLVVVSVFLVSWLPVIYMTIVNKVLGRPDLFTHHLEVTSLFTIAGSSLINPILYGLMKRDFVAQLRRLRN